MSRSTRNLLIITFLVLAIFLALNLIARRSALGDWGAVLFFLLLALGIWFYDRVSRRGIDDSEASDTVIEPLVYDHLSAPIAIPDSIQMAAPVVAAPPVVISQPSPAPAPVPPPVDEKAAPPPSAPAPVTPPEPAATPVVEVPPPTKEAKPAKRASKAKSASAQADDLKIVEGIGPKMEKALNAAGITTFAQLAASTDAQIHAAIEAAGMRFAPSVPTWAKQAAYAAKGDFTGLEAYQKTLVGGRKAK